METKITMVDSDFTEKRYVFRDLHPHQAMNEVGKLEVSDCNAYNDDIGDDKITLEQFIKDYIVVAGEYTESSNLLYTDDCICYI